MRVLITGGAGFLGSHLCDAMLAEGHVVVCADNLLTGYMENIAHLAHDRQFEFLEHDVCIPFDPGKINYIFHSRLRRARGLLGAWHRDAASQFGRHAELP